MVATASWSTPSARQSRQRERCCSAGRTRVAHATYLRPVCTSAGMSSIRVTSSSSLLPSMTLKRPLYGPSDPRGPSRGRDVLIVKRSLHRVEENFFPRPDAGFTEVYNEKTAAAVEVFQH